jgi:CheY-like chemotaxis protein
MPVVQFLRDCGNHVVEAASTDEAIAILQNTNTPIDVVLSEIDIPGSMNGFGFAQWARSVRPELKILLAGTPERTIRNAAELCEVGPTLKRPYDHKRVLHRIKRLLAARARSREEGDTRLLRRKPGSCMERSCVRSHRSGHRCCGTRHLVRPRRVNPARQRRGPATLYGYDTSGRDRRSLFLSRAPRCPTGVCPSPV